jgi:hypothetical protein
LHTIYNSGWAAPELFRFSAQAHPAIYKTPYDDFILFSGLQVHCEAFFPQPEQTLFSIGLPHFLHGVQPHTWHIFYLLIKKIVPKMPKVKSA